jgi:hypothetical protein
MQRKPLLHGNGPIRRSLSAAQLSPESGPDAGSRPPAAEEMEMDAGWLEMDTHFELSCSEE